MDAGHRLFRHPGAVPEGGLTGAGLTATCTSKKFAVFVVGVAMMPAA